MKKILSVFLMIMTLFPLCALHETATLTLRATVPPKPARVAFSEDGWSVTGDGIASFSLSDGIRTSYGLKGNLEGFDRNIIVSFTAP